MATTTTRHQQESTHAGSDRSRWLALYVLCVGMLMIVLDVTDRERRPALDPGRPRLLPASLAWVVNAYLIAFGGLLLLAGRLGDLIGSADVFLAGLASSPPPRCCAAPRRARSCSSARASSRASAAR